MRISLEDYCSHLSWTCLYWHIAAFYWEMVVTCTYNLQNIFVAVFWQQTDSEDIISVEQKLEDYKKILLPQHPSLKHTCCIADSIKELTGHSGLF